MTEMKEEERRSRVCAMRRSRANQRGLLAGAASDSQNTAYVPIASGSANLTYLAQYVATGAATAGAVTTSVTYTIEFQ